ncbi:hypothetical protein A2J03_10190 [Rhodococcus sp. EPR-157]|nr:hypothetical protein A2J03_10190 [Rhodococcus sp. EPR-157]
MVVVAAADVDSPDAEPSESLLHDAARPITTANVAAAAAQRAPLLERFMCPRFSQTLPVTRPRSKAEPRAAVLEIDWNAVIEANLPARCEGER